MLVLNFILLVLWSCSYPKNSHSKSNDIDVCSIWLNGGKDSTAVQDLVYTGVRPAAGLKAGKYSEIMVDNWDECVKKCCEFSRCNVAYWVSSTCVHIECISDELCKPKIENSKEDIFYLKVHSVLSTAAAIDYDDPGHDECNETMSCADNEQCESVSINAQIKRNVCSCDRASNFRRINGVCRHYLPRTRPCALYENDEENDDDDDDDNVKQDSGKCKKNEECLPPSDRAKHGYCQCKMGFIRKDASKRCVMDHQETISTKFSTATESTSTSSLYDFEVRAGDDQTVKLPKNDIDLYGHAIYKSNKTEINTSELNSLNLNLVWSLKSTTNGAKVDISNQLDLESHAIIKQLQEGIYEFELKLNNKQGTTLASDTVKIEVISAQTTVAPLIVKVPSSVNVNLPDAVTKIEAHVEPSNQNVTYQWTYLKDGPITPTFENTDKAELSISDLRPGNYSIQLDITDKNGKQETRTIRVFAVGEPLLARVKNHREIVFWPSNDVILDGTPSIIEKEVHIYWTLLSTDNKQEATDIDIIAPHALKTRISNLRMGQYKFELKLVTNDKQYESRDEILVVVYAQNGQRPKISITLETNNVNILNNLVILNASTTKADYGIAKWIWTKSPSSPAIGYFINNSQFSPIAYITNLIEGQYVFILQVYDDRQQMSEKNITINVDNVPDRETLVEIILLSKPYLYQQALDNLLVQMRVFLLDIVPNIQINMVGMLKDNTLLISGADPKANSYISPKIIANHLRNKIKSLRSASNLGILSIDTLLCLSNCSNHGKCDQKTKRCICDKYFMENWYKSLIYREPNCDFQIQYFVPIAITGSVAALIICWLGFCCCLRWKRRHYLLERRRRIRYRLLQDDDNDKEDVYSSNEGSIKVKTSKKNNTKESNKIMYESDELSDENGEQTLYDKPLLTAKMQAKSPTIRSRGLKVAIQDSNGSPMVRDNAQSSLKSDHSVA